MADTVLDTLLADYGAARQIRATGWEARWQKISDYVLPGQNFQRNAAQPTGPPRVRQIYDQTAIDANAQLAAAIDTFLTNAATKWFVLRTGEEPRDSIPAVREWFDFVRDAMLVQFSRKSAGFSANVHELYLSLPSLGTAIMFVGTMPNGDPFFQSIPLEECALRENDRGEIDTIFHERPMTYRQVRSMFGDKANAIVNFAEKLRTKPDEITRILHIVTPREQRAPGNPSATNKPFASIWIDLTTKTRFHESGFDEFRYLTPRWFKLSGDVYGRSQAMIALPTILLLNEVKRTTLKAIQKMADPVLQIPNDTFTGPLRFTPGSQVYFRSDSPRMIEPIKTEGRPDLSMALIEAERAEIRRAFFNNLLQIREGDRMTAEEVITRRNESMRLLSPMVSRLQQEFLDPLIELTFRLMFRAGRFPPVPAELADAVLRIEYASPLTRAQRMGDTDAFRELIETFVPLAGIIPDKVIAVFENLDMDFAFRRAARSFDYPEAGLLDPAVVAEARAEQAELARVAQQAAISKDIGAGVRDAATAASTLQTAA